MVAGGEVNAIVSVDGGFTWELDGGASVSAAFQGISSQKLNTDIIKFNASESNAIYGSSETVQPPAICLIPQIKY